MRKTTAAAIAVLALAASGAGPASAQRRAAPDAQYLSHIHSAFLTQADPAVLASPVLLGPELQRELEMPASMEGPQVYEALLSRAGPSTVKVRKATPQEVGEYGVRRGFDPKAQLPLYIVEAGERRYLVQYDVQRLGIGYVGQLGIADPDPIVMEQASKSFAAEGLTAVALRETPPLPEPLRLQWRWLFELDSAVLTPQAQAALDEEILAKLLARGGAGSIQISGHADRLGPADYNRKLSESRAHAVREYLVAKGIEASRIEVVGYGDRAPLQTCENLKGAALIECLAPNRRVELEITAQ